MKAWIIFTLIGSIRAGMVTSIQEVTLLYDDPMVSEPVSMKVNINRREETIGYHMHEQGNMGDVETLEDYTTGFAASRDAEEEGCFIRQLGSNLEDAIKDLEKTSSSGPQQYSGNQDLIAEPSDDLSEVVGERLTNFCGEYLMYKLLLDDDENKLDENEEPDERFFFFRRRCRFFHHHFTCFRIFVNCPTGRTLVFPFFFRFPFFG